MVETDKSIKGNNNLLSAHLNNGYLSNGHSKTDDEHGSDGGRRKRHRSRRCDSVFSHAQSSTVTVTVFVNEDDDDEYDGDDSDRRTPSIGDTRY